MTDYRSERRARRHQDLPEAASPPDSGSTPPPSSALSDGGGWKPLDDKARGGAAVTVRSEAGEIAAEARRLAPGAEILFYTDLISRARIRQAA